MLVPSKTPNAIAWAAVRSCVGTPLNVEKLGMSEANFLRCCQIITILPEIWKRNCSNLTQLPILIFFRSFIGEDFSEKHGEILRKLQCRREKLETRWVVLKYVRKRTVGRTSIVKVFIVQLRYLWIYHRIFRDIVSISDTDGHQL